MTAPTPSRDTLAALPLLPEPLGRALAELRRQAGLRLAWWRVWAALGALAGAAAVGLGTGGRLVGCEGPLSAYAVAALLVLALARGRLRPLSAFAVPLLDVPAVYAVQLATLHEGHPGWSLGLLAVLLVVASLSFRTEVVVSAALAALVAEGALRWQAGDGFGSLAASALVLALTAAVTLIVARRWEDLLRRLVLEEVKRRRDLERNEHLAQANRTIKQINHELVQAQREAELVTSLLVHDLKGPLTGLLGHLDLISGSLERAAVRPQHAAHLLKDSSASAMMAGRRLLGMIGDLLAVSRLERGVLVPAPQAANARELLEEVLATQAGLATRQQVKLDLRCDEDLWGEVDVGLLRRALENVLSNALRYVGPGKTVETVVAREGEQWVVSVHNDGPPLDPKVRAHLFEKYGKGGEAAHHNLGLGLYMCRLVCEGHGGSIACADVPPWAVSFVLRLPARARNTARPRPSGAHRVVHPTMKLS